MNIENMCENSIFDNYATHAWSCFDLKVEKLSARMGASAQGI